MKNLWTISLVLLAACSERPATPAVGSAARSGAKQDSGDASAKSDDVYSGSNQKTSDDASTDSMSNSAADNQTAMNAAADEAAKKAAQEKADQDTVTKVFDGFRWEFACDVDPGDSDQCNSNAKVDETRMIPALQGQTYTLTLRFRGVVEPMMYKDGMRSGDRFYIGGSPNNGTYNIYAIEVSNPKQTYYLNYADSVGHDTRLIDYTDKIKVAAGATIKFTGDGQNGVEISNFRKLVTPDVPPSTFFNGQFIQMNVVSIALEGN